MESTLQITREVQTSRSVNVSISTVYRTSRKAEQKITFQLLKSLIDSILVTVSPTQKDDLLIIFLEPATQHLKNLLILQRKSEQVPATISH